MGLLNRKKKEKAETEKEELIKKEEVLKKKPQKLVNLYICTKAEGEQSAFAKPEELIAHLQQAHNIIIVTEAEVNEYRQDVSKDEAKALLENTQKLIKQAELESKAASQRIEKRLAGTQEPERILNPEAVKDAGDVFRKATKKLAQPEGANPQESFWAQEESEDEVTVTFTATMANNTEVQEAIANFKTTMMRNKI
ncbi:Uncharacterised protein [uncultured archaeon]|nr:Uncharacterised protein [uncultured archaeon]